MRDTGKPLIIGMVVVGLLAAGAGWWFRFSATHRAAQFWGPQAAALVRSAESIELIHFQPPITDWTFESEELGAITDRRDVSHAPGITHLRQALLEDRSFDWSAGEPPADIRWDTCLRFSDTGDEPPRYVIYVMLSPDRRWIVSYGLGAAAVAPQVISCAPIADGLAEVLNEWSETLPAIR